MQKYDIVINNYFAELLRLTVNISVEMLTEYKSSHVKSAFQSEVLIKFVFIIIRVLVKAENSEKLYL